GHRPVAVQPSARVHDHVHTMPMRLVQLPWPPLADLEAHPRFPDDQRPRTTPLALVEADWHNTSRSRDARGDAPQRADARWQSGAPGDECYRPDHRIVQRRLALAHHARDASSLAGPPAQPHLSSTPHPVYN